jgi:hypothetical protein
MKKQSLLTCAKKKNCMFSRMYRRKYRNNAGRSIFLQRYMVIIDRLLKNKSKPDETMEVPVLFLERFADEAGTVI